MFPKKKYTIVLTHLLLWSLLGFVYIANVPVSLGVSFPPQYWIKQGSFFLVLMGLYYLNARVLVPRLLRRQNPTKFICLHVGIVTLLEVAGAMVDKGINMPQLMVNAINRRFVGILHIELRGLQFDSSLLLTSCLLIGISTSITVIQIWQRDSLKSQQLLQKQLDSELSFLKAQIHPHFFFNTLNNIYSLTYTDVEGSRASLHKLSRMMRYLLYDTQNDQTSLQKEIDFVRDYIELMQLRINGHTTVRFEHLMVPQETTIAPMILLPFVENAFKHGVSSVLKSEIGVKIRQQQNMLVFDVENTLFAATEKPFFTGTVHDIDDGGIGIANTRRRLDLIYAEHYLLKYGPDDGKYLVHLELSL